MDGGTGRASRGRASDVPMRVRRRQSDARWRANVASCFETLKNIIPVNKRASKRQISKAYVLQETSKHIHFLEGILTTLLKEKANEEGKEPETFNESFDKIREDFIQKQQEKIAALCNERKYKRNKYKLYIADNLIQTEANNHPQTAVLHTGKKKASPKIPATPTVPTVHMVKTPKKSKPRKPRVVVSAPPKSQKSQTIRVIVHPMKHILNRIRKPKEHKDFVPTESSLEEILETKPPFTPLHIVDTPASETDPPKPKIKRQTRKRRAVPKEATGGKRPRGGRVGRPVQPVLQSEAPQPGFSSYAGVPEKHNVLVEAAHPPYVYTIWSSNASHFSGIRGVQEARGMESPVQLSGDVSITDLELTGLKAEASTPVLTSIHLNSTPAKKVCGNPAFSTPGAINTDTSFQLALTPISRGEEEEFVDEGQFSTPLKQIKSHTEESPCFTPVVLPTDWICTPTKSPATPSSAFTADLIENHEPLECDEDISSEEEDHKKRAVLSSGQSQAVQHRESKLHPVRTRHRTASTHGDNSSNTSDMNRSANISCKRSLNMSLDIGNTTMPSLGNDSWTEECLKDFDRYYEELKDAKDGPGEVKVEEIVPLEAMWELAEDVTTGIPSNIHATLSTGPPECTTTSYQPEQLTKDLEIKGYDYLMPDMERFIQEYEGSCSQVHNTLLPLDAIDSFIPDPTFKHVENPVYKEIHSATKPEWTTTNKVTDEITMENTSTSKSNILGHGLIFNMKSEASGVAGMAETPGENCQNSTEAVSSFKTEKESEMSDAPLENIIQTAALSTSEPLDLSSRRDVLSYWTLDLDTDFGGEV